MSGSQPGDDERVCHYCDTANPADRESCSRCGMALPELRFDRRRRARRRFVWLFAAVVLFCAVMIWYLPR